MFFFYIDKGAKILKKRYTGGAQGIQDPYTHHQKDSNRERSTKQKGLQHPQQDPNQSMKLTKVRGQSSINNLASNQRKQTKAFFSLSML